MILLFWTDLDSKVEPVKNSAAASELAQSGSSRMTESQKIHIGVAPCPKQDQHPTKFQSLSFWFLWRNLWGRTHDSGNLCRYFHPYSNIFSLLPAAAFFMAIYEHCLISTVHHWERFCSAFSHLKKKQAVTFSIMQNSCWYRDLGKFLKTNGKNWSTSCFPAQTELGRGVGCCHCNCINPCCSFGLQQQESFRKEVGGGGERMSHPHCLWWSWNFIHRSNYQGLHHLGSDERLFQTVVDSPQVTLGHTGESYKAKQLSTLLIRQLLQRWNYCPSSSNIIISWEFFLMNMLLFLLCLSRAH